MEAITKPEKTCPTKTGKRSDKHFLGGGGMVNVPSGNYGIEKGEAKIEHAWGNKTHTWCKLEKENFLRG